MERLFREMIGFYAGDPHQIQHFAKVHGFARMIGIGERLEEETLQILEMAAIVHDIGIKPALEKYDSAAGPHQELEGPPLAREMLARLGYPPHITERVCHLVGHHHTYTGIDGMDYQILVEADFLVNMHEGKMSAEGIDATLRKIFRTPTGSAYGRTMFLGGDGCD